MIFRINLAQLWLTKVHLFWKGHNSLKSIALWVWNRVSKGRDVRQDVPGQTGTGRPVVPLSRDKKVSMSPCPFVLGQKSFACTDVPLSWDKDGTSVPLSLCPGTVRGLSRGTRKYRTVGNPRIWKDQSFRFKFYVCVSLETQSAIIFELKYTVPILDRNFRPSNPNWVIFGKNMWPSQILWTLHSSKSSLNALKAMHSGE